MKLIQLLIIDYPLKSNLITVKLTWFLSIQLLITLVNKKIQCIVFSSYRTQ